MKALLAIEPFHQDKAQVQPYADGKGLAEVLGCAYVLIVVVQLWFQFSSIHASLVQCAATLPSTASSCVNLPS